MKVVKNTPTLVNYIMKYITKPETNSMSFDEIVQQVSRNSEETEPVKKIVQKMMLSLVKEHDMSKNEAFKVISRKDYVLFSRSFEYINLTDKRRVNLAAFKSGIPEAEAMTSNSADRYWTRDTDPNYEKAVEAYEEGSTSSPCDPRGINLYTFASLYDRKWNYTGRHKIPVPTPQFNYVPNKKKNPEAYKTYCEVQLQLFKAGSDPTNLLLKDNNDPNSDQFADAEEALIEFVQDKESQCPQYVRDEFLKALKVTRDNVEVLPAEFDDLLPEQFENTDLEEGNLMEGLDGPLTAITDNADLENQLAAGQEAEEEEEEADYEELNLTHSGDHDWSADRTTLNLSTQDIRTASNWIKEMKITADLNTDGPTGNIDPNSMNNEQYWVYRTAMEAMENPERQRLIDVCGAAGTGKSYTVNAILQEAKRAGHRVQVMAPTGAAASQFVGAKTIHSCLKLTVCKKNKKEGEDEHFEELSTDWLQ